MPLFRRSSSLFFNDTATTEIYTLSLHDALPIWSTSDAIRNAGRFLTLPQREIPSAGRKAGDAPSNSRTETTSEQLSNFATDRKSTRLNSSHSSISYAVFCLKKKKKKKNRTTKKE